MLAVVCKHTGSIGPECGRGEVVTDGALFTTPMNDELSLCEHLYVHAKLPSHLKSSAPATSPALAAILRQCPERRSKSSPECPPPWVWNRCATSVVSRDFSYCRRGTRAAQPGGCKACPQTTPQWRQVKSFPCSWVMLRSSTVGYIAQSSRRSFSWAMSFTYPLKVTMDS